MKTLAVALVVLAVISLAAGHGLMTSPTARSGTSDTAKSACSGTASAVAATWNAGSTITASYSIHANHGGSVVWKISYDGNPANLVNIGPTSQVTATGDFNVQIPLEAGKTCDACLFEWYWASSEPAPYIGCATVKIQGTSNESVFCKSGLVKCSSASTLSFSALLVALIALLALLF